MDNVLQKIEQFKIVPVVTIQKIEDAEGMLGALCRGGLPLAEICFRTDCAEEAIRLDDSRAEAYLMRGQIYLSQHKKSEAKDDFEKAVERGIPPSDVAPLLKLCR